MTTFFMFGKYSTGAVEGINAKRTERAESIINGFGGKLHSVYILLGEYDIVIIAELHGNEEAIRASVEITKLTGISFSTSPAIPVVDFDRLVTD